MSVKAFELIPVIERINVMSDRSTTQIVCVECCGKNIYFGTEDCFVIHYLLEEKSETGGKAQYHSSRLSHKFLGLKKPVMQLKAASAINRILVLCDNTLSMLNMLNLEPVISGGKIKSVQYFTINENPARSNPFSVEVCVATRRRCIQVYVISEDRVTLTKEVTTSDVPITLSMDGLHVCVALTSQYNIINVETGNVQDLFEFDSEHVKPIVTRISMEEFLLSASSALGVFAMLRGMSRRPPLQWSNNVTGVVYSHPYILALNDEFITVHSILDQHQKQTIPFSGARCIGEFDGRIYVVTSRDVYQLLSIPVEKQIQSLLADKRVSEALELAHSARKLTTSKEEFARMLQRIQKQAGFIELAQMNFEEATELFRSSQLDVRELITLYPGLLPSNSTFNRSAPPLHDIADINQLTRGEVKQSEAYERFLLSYIEDLRAASGAKSMDQTAAFTSETDTALIKLYAKFSPSQLITFIDTSTGFSLTSTRPVSSSAASHKPRSVSGKLRLLDCDIKDCCDWMARFGCHYAVGLLCVHVGENGRALDVWTRIYSGDLKDVTFPGLQLIVNFLTRLEEVELVWKYADWVMSSDQVMGVKIFTDRWTPEGQSPPESGPERSAATPTTERRVGPSTSLTDPDVIVDYLVGRYERAVIIYLEHLVNQRNLQKEKFHTHLAVLYLDQVLKLLKQEEGGETGRGALLEARKKLSDFLQRSSLYRVQLLLGKIQNTELYAECAILYGKLEEHDKALRLLVHKLRDFDAAENYCMVNSAVGNESHRTRLFTALLSVYLDPTNERRDTFVGPAISLLNNSQAEFDSIKVLQMLPDGWSVGLLHQFLMRSVRKSLAQNRVKRVERMLSRCENLRVRACAMDIMHQRLTVTEDIECQVCHQCFTDPEFVRYPNGVLAHIHCASDPRICPVTGTVFSRPKPSDLTVALAPTQQSRATSR